MKIRLKWFRIRLMTGILAITASLQSVAQAEDAPCSLATFAEVGEWAGIMMKNTLPQGNLRVLASCTFDGIDRPPVLTYAVTRGEVARESYNSNKIWPDVTNVSCIGLGAM